MWDIVIDELIWEAKLYLKPFLNFGFIFYAGYNNRHIGKPFVSRKDPNSYEYNGYEEYDDYEYYYEDTPHTPVQRQSQIWGPLDYLYDGRKILIEESMLWAARLSGPIFESFYL